MNYQEFLKSKLRLHRGVGFHADTLSGPLFPFQEKIVRWACMKGKAAIFADCGLGKTLMQLSWADMVPGKKLIVAPLAVAEQTIREGEKFHIPVGRIGSDENIVITNYEQLHKIDVSGFNGVVLDESSILKNYTGKIRNNIIEAFSKTKYKLACSATPAPNDFMELGNHCEFLDICSRSEMLAEYFTHDMETTQKWRIKGHAQNDFWKWLSSWAITIQNPSDLGYDDTQYKLPELIIKHETVRADYQQHGFLFPMMVNTLEERRNARKFSVGDRAQLAAEMIAKSNEPWIVWCNLNDEAEEMCKALPEAVEIRGSHSNELKAQRMMDFTDGKIRVLVTKPKIAGFGMNWQHCNNILFLGLSDSYESFYQAVRRCWRFGQKNDVTVHILTSDVEGAVTQNIQRKEMKAMQMNSEITKKYVRAELRI
jgi:superfamily II DNA or RNA helicase